MKWWEILKKPPDKDEARILNEIRKIQAIQMERQPGFRRVTK